MYWIGVSFVSECRSRELADKGWLQAWECSWWEGYKGVTEKNIAVKIFCSTGVWLS